MQLCGGQAARSDGQKDHSLHFRRMRRRSSPKWKLEESPTVESSLGLSLTRCPLLPPSAQATEQY